MSGALLAVVVLGGCSGNEWWGYERECVEYVETYGGVLTEEAGLLAAELGGSTPEGVTCDDTGGPPAWVSFDLAAPGNGLDDTDAGLTELGWVLDSAEDGFDGYEERWYVAGDGSGVNLVLTRFTDGDVDVTVYGPASDDA